ncbi:hypothetical protein ACFL0X_01795 [Nanoarchaeota archaeon]
MENKVFTQLNFGKSKMNTKNLLVSFALVSVLLLTLLTSSVSAEGYIIEHVEVNDVGIIPNSENTGASVVAGQLAKVEVWFEATQDFSEDFDSDVTVEVEFDTGKDRGYAVSESMVVEEHERGKVTLMVEVPYELDDEQSEFIDLRIEIDGEHYDVAEDYLVKVKRSQYESEIKSISVSNSIQAGETFPVDVVLENTGYLDLDDVYVSVSIPALGIEDSRFFGELVSLERDECEEVDGNGVVVCYNEDDENTGTVRLYLEVPHDVAEGVYSLEVEVRNDDVVSSEVKEVFIENDFSSGNVIVSGEDLLVVNPTNKVMVLRFVPESTEDLSVSLSESTVVVSPGSSKTVTVTVSGASEGTHSYVVNVFALDGELVDSLTLSKTVLADDESSVRSPVVILTIVLAILFIVLLVVLIVLLGRKPAKSEEFGESYY